jgi:DNA replication protein DnaC
VTISGAPGVGKSCVAVFALNYLAERHYFSDGVIHVEAS